MPAGAKPEKAARTAADVRRERLAAQLRSNLLKRKRQARNRTAAAEPADQDEDQSGR